MNTPISQKLVNFFGSLGQFLPSRRSFSQSDIKIVLLAVMIFSAFGLAIRMFLCSGSRTAANPPVSPRKEESPSKEPVPAELPPSPALHPSPRVDNREDQLPMEESSPESPMANLTQPEEQKDFYAQPIQQKDRVPVIPPMPDLNFELLFAEMRKMPDDVQYDKYIEDFQNCRFTDIFCPSKTRIEESKLRSDGRVIQLHANKVVLEGISFIAAQYPMPDQIPLFWHMGGKSCLILDLTNERDRQKGLDLYYPLLNQEKNIDGLKITCNAQKSSPDIDAVFSIYMIEESHDKDAEKVQCDRLHFEGWKDFDGITENDLGILLDLMEKCQPDLSVPIVVHCRAGVGRTGTILVARALMKLIRENKVDESNLSDEIRRLILEGRKQRGRGFVQTPIQLKAIWKWAWKAIHQPRVLGAKPVG